MSGEITTEHRGAVAIITVADPDRRNALTLELSADLATAVTAAQEDERIRALVVTGTPPAFCAGADLTVLEEAHEDGLRAVYSGFLALAQCTLPTIAAVGGPAVGAGLNLALAADIRIAGPRARFDARFLRLGLHPGGGMTWMLQRILGPQRATAMTLLGEVLDAEAAREAGLVLRTVDGDHDQLVDSACTLAAGAEDVSRELLASTKHTMRTTAALDHHAQAVDAEITPQIESTSSTEFAQQLAATKARISGTERHT